MARGQKTGGRKKGSQNKISKVTRDIIADIAAGMVDRVVDDIADLDPKDRVHVFIKLCEFNISKPQTVSLDVTGDKQKTIEDALINLAPEQ